MIKILLFVLVLLASNYVSYRFGKNQGFGDAYDYFFNNGGKKK
jgi:hypothetical protein